MQSVDVLSESKSHLSQTTNILTRMGRFVGEIGNAPDWQKIVIIFVLSISVKMAYVVVLGGGMDAHLAEASDVEFYDGAARGLLQTGVYGNFPGQPTVSMPPGESVFLAFLYLIGGSSIVFAKLGHILVLSLAAVLTFLTGRRLVNSAVGFWAGVLVAIDPAQAYLSGTFLSDGLFIFLMILGIYFVMLNESKESWLRLLMAGVCFGLAGLTRNQGWLFAVALWIGALVSWGRLMPIRSATLVLLVTAAVIAPWTLRNLRVTGEFIPVSSEGGLTLWASNNPEFVWRAPMPMSRPIYARPPGLSSSEIDRYYRQRAIQWITTHPAEFVLNGIRKVIVLYNFDPMSWRPEVSVLYLMAGFVPYGIMLSFIMIGLVLNFKRPEYRVVLWYVLFTTAMAAVFYGDSRIRAPIQPYLYLFGVLGIGAAIRYLERRWPRPLISRER